MPQNRNQLIDLLIGNLSNAVVHEILAKAIDDDNIRNHYSKELQASFDVAKKYRDKINPLDKNLPAEDIIYIYEKTSRRVNAELKLRISKGYTCINLAIVDTIIEQNLKRLKIAQT